MKFLLVHGIARRLSALFGLFLFCLIVGYFGVTSWKTPIHQFNLWKLKKEFNASLTIHPNDTERVLSFKKFGGRFSSATNSCSYFVGEFRIGALAKEDIERHYRAFPIRVRFWDEDEFWTDYPWFELYPELLRVFDAPSEQVGLYVVFVSEEAPPPYADFRC